MAVSRRQFIQRSATTIAVGMALPSWLARLAVAADLNDSSGTANKRVLVVVQLGGGNDGLNTVVPYSAPEYRASRPTLALPEKDLLHISDDIAFNPVMSGLKRLYDNKQLAVVQGVGYPNPNRSHFRSMEIWQTAEPDRLVSEGWVGRYLDSIRAGRTSPLTGINIGSEASEALESAHSAVPTIQGLANFGVVFGAHDGDRRAQTLQRIQMSGSDSPYSALLQDTARETYASAERIHQSTGNYHSSVAYGPSAFEKGLKQIATLIAANLGTRIYYISTGGFDTHTNQSKRHPNLLKNLSDGLASFQQDLDAMGASGEVATVVFSEFGRRVHENAGGGTDHGTASEMFVLGGGVKGGLYGEYPSLANLDQGDLKFTTDFRSVYATLLDSWLRTDSSTVLGQNFGNLGFIRT